MEFIRGQGNLSIHQAKKIAKIENIKAMMDAVKKYGIY